MVLLSSLKVKVLLIQELLNCLKFWDYTVLIWINTSRNCLWIENHQFNSLTKVKPSYAPKYLYLHKINHHSKNHTSSLDQKSVMAKNKTLVPGAVFEALPLLASHSRSLRRHCSTPFLFIRSNYNHAVPILVRRGSTILFMTAGLSVQLLARAPSPIYIYLFGRNH